MKVDVWQDVLMQPLDQGNVWELFHENSKLTRYDFPPSDGEVMATMATMWQSLPFAGHPAVGLPTLCSPLNLSLSEAITTRSSTRDLTAVPLTLADLAALLFYAYGITRDNSDTGYSRPFRVVPSGGALYPLELFFHTAAVDTLEAGLYHYNPLDNAVRRVTDGDHSALIERSLVQPEVAKGSSLIIFITGMFERSTFKYRDRGYRFVLLEAGHVAQNINLVSNALGLGCINLGGFFDQRVDDFLDLDGLTHSAIYLVAIGGRARAGPNLLSGHRSERPNPCRFSWPGRR